MRGTSRRLCTAVLLCAVTLVGALPVNAAPPPGVGPPGGPGPQAAAPATPTGLAAQAGHESVGLTWAATTDNKVIALRVQRDGADAVELPATAVTWLDTGLVVGRTYRYTVTAVANGNKLSAPSTAVTAVPLDLVAPPAPGAPTATAGDAAVDLSWPAVTDAGLAGYRVYADGALVLATGAATTSTTLTGLTNGQPYAFTVTAVDAAGNESAHSPVAAATPRDTTPPAIPLGLAAEPGDASATLSWDAVDAADLAAYRVYLDGVLVQDVAAGTTTAALLELVNGQTYAVTVTAVDATGNESAPSDVATVTPQPPPPPPDTDAPPAPTALLAEAGDGIATLSWDAVDATDLAAYRVYLDGVLVEEVAAGDTTATLLDLTNGRTYEVTVTAVDEAGNESAPSAPASVTPTGVPTPPPDDLPTGLIAADDFEGPDRTDLVGRVTPVGSFPWAMRQLVNSNEGGLDVHITDGRTHGTYINGWYTSARVIDTGTHDGTVSLDVSSSGTITVGEAAGVIARQRPGAPGLTAVYEAVEATECPSGVKVVATHAGAGCVDGYGRITLSVSGDTAAVLHNGTLVASGRIPLAAQLAADATGWGVVHIRGSWPTIALRGDNFAVRGVDDAVAPRVPAPVTAYPQDSAVRLAWGGVGDVDLAGYRVYVDGARITDVGAAETTTTLDGLTNGTAYDVTVTAVDRFGNESAPSGPPVHVTPGTQVAFDDFAIPRPLDLTGTLTPVGGMTWRTRQVSNSNEGALDLYSDAGKIRGTYVNSWYTSARVIDAGMVDGEVSVDVSAVGTLPNGEYAGVIARQMPGQNGLVAAYFVVPATTCTSRVQAQVRYLSSTRYVDPVCVDGLGRIGLRTVGATVTLLHNGTAIGSGTITLAAHLADTATGWGLVHTRSTTTTSMALRLDDFEVTRH